MPPSTAISAPSYVGGILAREEERHARHFLGLADAPEWQLL